MDNPPYWLSTSEDASFLSSSLIQDGHKSYSKVQSFYEENGYVIIRSLVPEASINKIIADLNKFFVKARSLSKTSLEPATSFEDLTISLFEGDPIVRKNLYQFSQRLCSLRDCFNSSAVIRVVDQLMGSNVLLSRNHSLRFDIPGETYAQPLHIDVNSMLSLNAVNAWAALHDIDANTGGICILPGSHLNGPIPYSQKTNSGYGTFADEILLKYKQCFPKLLKGDVVFFGPFTVHGTALPSKHIQNPSLRLTAITRWDDATSINWINKSSNPFTSYHHS